MPIYYSLLRYFLLCSYNYFFKVSEHKCDNIHWLLAFLLAWCTPQTIKNCSPETYSNTHKNKRHTKVAKDKLGNLLCNDHLSYPSDIFSTSEIEAVLPSQLPSLWFLNQYWSKGFAGIHTDNTAITTSPS